MSCRFPCGRNAKEPPRAARWLAVCALAVMLGLAGWVGTHRHALRRIGHWAMARPGRPQRPFDTRVWRTAQVQARAPGVRGDMVVDLMRHHLRRGMTRSEVTALLGEPDMAAPDNEMTYRVGLRAGRYVADDTLTLVLRLSPDGRVTGWHLCDQ